MATTPAAGHADGLACLLGIGTANPPNCVQQEDHYFRVTKREHLLSLKTKPGRICT
nr:unnamed protein product [Digitaria exilis]